MRSLDSRGVMHHSAHSSKHCSGEWQNLPAILVSSPHSWAADWQAGLAEKMYDEIQIYEFERQHEAIILYMLQQTAIKFTFENWIQSLLQSFYSSDLLIISLFQL